MKYISEINTVADVKTFFNQLLDNEISFHPDNDFNDYVNQQGKRTFSKAKAKELNALMDKAFDVCRLVDDIYGIGIELTLAHPKFQYLKDSQ